MGLLGRGWGALVGSRGAGLRRSTPFCLSMQRKINTGFLLFFLFQKVGVGKNHPQWA